MIVDWFSEDPYDPPTIYERTRDTNGNLHETWITSEDEGYVYPFCWVRQNAPTWVLNRLVRAKARIQHDIVAKDING